jgi:hypothetical protein
MGRTFLKEVYMQEEDTKVFIQELMKCVQKMIKMEADIINNKLDIVAKILLEKKE